MGFNSVFKGLILCSVCVCVCVCVCVRAHVHACVHMYMSLAHGIPALTEA